MEWRRGAKGVQEKKGRWKDVETAEGGCVINAIAELEW